MKPNLRHPELVEGSVPPVAAVYDRRAFSSPNAVILSEGEMLRTAVNFSSQSVILSEGEADNLLSSQGLLEPQSKDLAQFLPEFEKRQSASLRRDGYSLLSLSRRPKVPRLKNVTRAGNTSPLTQARSFDCGSGESIRKTTLICSPSLRMTAFEEKFTANGATR
jgi:hypothetical protein